MVKKTFAKKTALLLAAVIAIGVCGCGKEEEKPQEKAVQTEIVEEEEQELLKNALFLAENAPELTASAAILIEESTGTILYEKKADERMYPASMTKVLTALVALDYFKPEELIKVGYEINEISLDSSKAGHTVGEMLTMKNAIRGLIIPSGNDSANVIAAAVARRVENDENLSFARCEAIFTDLMNQKAEELGAKNSHFSNAHGYHAADHYTTAKDMALISKVFMQNPTLEEIANERSFVGNGADNMFTTDASVKTQDYAWRSHNLLITGGEYNYGYASGIKTGFTNEAGDCVTAAARNDAMHLIAVVFHSEDPNRWIDAKNLFEYGFNQYEERVVYGGNESLAEIPLTKHKKSGGDTLSAVLGEPLVAYLPVGGTEKLSATVTCEESLTVTDKEGQILLKAPVEKGDKIGTVVIKAEEQVVMEAPVYAGRTVEKGTIFSMIAELFQNLFTLKGLLVFVGILVGVGILFFIIRVFLRRRYRGGYSLGRPARRNTGLTMNLNGKKRRTRRRRRF